MLVYAQEHLDATRRADVEALLPEQWAHTGDRDFNFSIDWAIYEKLAEMGALLAITARDEGALVGYVVGVVRRHPSATQVRLGTISTYYVRQERSDKAFVLKTLLEIARNKFAAVGVTVVDIETQYENSCGRLLEALGFAPNKIGYRMVMKEHFHA